MHQRQTLHGESRGDRQLNRRHSTTTVAATMGAQLHWWSSRTVCDNTDSSKHVDKQPQVVVGLACTGPDRCAWNADASGVVNALLQRWWSHVLIESTRCVRLSLDTAVIRHADTQWLSTMTEQGEGGGHSLTRGASRVAGQMTLSYPLTALRVYPCCDLP